VLIGVSRGATPHVSSRPSAHVRGSGGAGGVTTLASGVVAVGSPDVGGAGWALCAEEPQPITSTLSDMNRTTSIIRL